MHCSLSAASVCLALPHGLLQSGVSADGSILAGGDVDQAAEGSGYGEGACIYKPPAFSTERNKILSLVPYLVLLHVHTP